MFDLVNGLPVHPLVVHAVVVLLPLGILGTVAIAVRAPWRARYGVLVTACTAAATVLMPVATSSGEELEKHVGDPGNHAELGDQLIWFALPLLALNLALVWMDRRAAALDSTATSAVRAPGGRALTVVAALSVLVAIAAGVQVYRVGDSGARAAWGDRVSAK